MYSESILKFGELVKYSDRLLPNNQLTVLCKGCIEGCLLPSPDELICLIPTPKALPSIEISEKEYTVALESLLKNPEPTSDLKITLDDNQFFPAHKCVLSSRSPVFAAMFSHNNIENLSNSVHLFGISSDVARLLLKYLYTGRVALSSEFAPDLMKLSDMYDLENLKYLCEENLFSFMTPTNVGYILGLAQICAAEQLLDNAKCLIRMCCVWIVKDTVQWKAIQEIDPEFAGEVLEMSLS